MTCPAEKWPAALRARPLCTKRKITIPFIAEVDPVTGVANFGVFDSAKVKACVDGRLCAMCGARMGAEIAFIGDAEGLGDKEWIEPPVHERCAEVAMAGLCPFVALERVPRRPVQEGVGVVAIDAAELEQVGRTIAKRPSVMALTRTYKPILVRNHAGGVSVMYRAGPLTRLRRYAWRDGRLAELTELTPPRR